MKDVPEELRGHKAMAGVTKKIIQVLGNMLNKWTQSDPPTASEKQRKLEVANALAKALGPVHIFFGQSRWLPDPDEPFYICLSLKTHILALPPKAMEALLASDSFEANSENDVYTFLGCWVYQSSFGADYRADDESSNPFDLAECIPLFLRLVKFVRLQHLSLDYVANVITACPLANESGFLPSILRSSLLRRETDPAGQRLGLVQLVRGRNNRMSKYTTTLALADLLALSKGEYKRKCLGLVDGYPVRIAIYREPKEELETSTFGIYAFVIMPSNDNEEAWADGVNRHVSFW